MKTKKVINKSVRDVRLSVRLDATDQERLEEIRQLMSPYAPLSKGKAISAALKLAQDRLLEKRGGFGS